MLRNRKTLHATKSPYGSYKIVEGRYNERPARVLYGDKRTPQSGVALDDEPELLFHYTQRFLEMGMSLRPKKVLIIGGGACVLPVALLYRLPEATIDVVEIDAALVTVARNFFALPSDDRLRIHIQDGADYIRHTKERYDMIIIDAFSGYTIPPHLTQHSILQHYRRCLTSRGVIAFNFIAEYNARRVGRLQAYHAAFREIFSACTIFQADPHYAPDDAQNLLLVAGTTVPHFDYLQTNELAFKTF